MNMLCKIFLLIVWTILKPSSSSECNQRCCRLQKENNKCNLKLERNVYLCDNNEIHNKIFSKETISTNHIKLSSLQTKQKHFNSSFYVCADNYSEDECNKNNYSLPFEDGFNYSLKDISNQPRIWLGGKTCGELKLLIINPELIFAFSILCVIGNVVVICQKLVKIKKLSSNASKESRVYHLLVLNLSLADLLMGIHLISALSLFVNNRFNYKTFKLCNELGIINFLSSQVSLSTITMISVYRMLSVVRPYKRTKLKLVLIMIVVTWLFWLIFAVIPVVDIEPIKSYFTIGVFSFRNDSLFHVDISSFQHLLHSLKNEINKSSSLNALTSVTYPDTYTEFTKTLSSFNVIDLEKKEDWFPIGFYSGQPYCTVSLFVDNIYLKSYHYTLFFLLFNLVLCLIVTIAYVIIILSIRKKKALNMCCLNKCQKTNQNSPNLTIQRNKENQKVFVTITLIVFTDLICWSAICFTSLIIFGIFSNENDSNCLHYLSVFCKFQMALVILLPINSVLNPYFYSYHFWKKIIKKFKQKYF